METNNNIPNPMNSADGTCMSWTFVVNTLALACHQDTRTMMSEDEIRALVYDSIDEEMLVVGDKAAQMRSSIRSWARMSRDKVAEIVLCAYNVANSGRWLAVRIDQATERMAESYYISSDDGVDDVDRLLEVIDSVVISTLPFTEIRQEIRLFVLEVIRKLTSKLRKLWQTATSKRPLSTVYEIRWAKSWKEDVLAPSPSEVKDYEKEIARMQTIDDTMTRKEVLQVAIDSELEVISDNLWGDIYLTHRENPRQLVKEISANRFNEGGEALDELRFHARKYEWLMAEMKKLQTPEPAMPPQVVIKNPGSVSINDIHDNQHITLHPINYKP